MKFTIVAFIALGLIVSCGKKKDEPAPAPVVPSADTPEVAPSAPNMPDMPRAVSKCPAKTTVTALEATRDLSAVGPLDLATFSFAKARWNENRTDLKVYVANKDWTLAQLGSLKSPVASNGEAYLIVSFRQDTTPPVGTYPASMHDQTVDRYVSTSLFVNGEALGVSLGESKAEIVELANGKVCGTFDLNGDMERDGRTTHFAGTFVAELPL